MEGEALMVFACAQEEGIKVELSRDLDYDGVCEALFQQLKGALSSQPLPMHICDIALCVAWSREMLWPGK